MRIAVPVVGKKLSAHFGHCEKFSIVDVDMEKKAVIKIEELDAPPHEPGLLPVWLANHSVSMILAGGMGARAQEIFASHDIQVMVGVQSERVDKIVDAFLAGTLSGGENVCDH